ncbi:MAG TPA: methyltransferase domain-containing protein [Thermohalobaculum sp.]|nr:methyltransferase domain-containing protein [Thermohalobaculum sp.]
MTGQGRGPRRSPEEIRALMDLRARRAIEHFTGLARGRTPRLCPVCGYRGLFSPVRHKPEIWCPSCDSRPRHRLLKLWVDREMALPAGARVLHFAAEPFARDWFEARGAEYLTADIDERHDLSLDIEAMALPDASFDMVIANHVLEHVDDARALAEMFRVLRPGGQAVLTVPMVEGWDETYEDPGLSAAERRLRYGDPLHRRFYGRDLRQRIVAAGFRLAEFAGTEPDVSAHALHRGERVFIGVRPA